MSLRGSEKDPWIKDDTDATRSKPLIISYQAADLEQTHLWDIRHNYYAHGYGITGGSLLYVEQRRLGLWHMRQHADGIPLVGQCEAPSTYNTTAHGWRMDMIQHRHATFFSVQPTLILICDIVSLELFIVL